VDSWLLFTPSNVTDQMLKLIVERHGGEWQILSTMKQGVINRGCDGVVFLYLYPSFPNEYDEKQMETIRDRVGKDAASAVSITPVQISFLRIAARG